MYQSFEELEVWKKGCQLAVAVYESLREVREFALRDQMQRAAVSIPSNIAEGAERGGKDFERFLRIARGSAAELRTQLYISKRLGLLPDDRYFHLISEVKGVSKMLTDTCSLASNRNRRADAKDQARTSRPAFEIPNTGNTEHSRHHDRCQLTRLSLETTRTVVTDRRLAACRWPARRARSCSGTWELGLPSRRALGEPLSPAAESDSSAKRSA